jgi:hypothetical protein
MKIVLFWLGAACAVVGATMGIAGERFWGGQWSGLVIIGLVPALMIWAVALLLPASTETPDR